MDDYKNTKSFKTLNFYTLKKSHPYQRESPICLGYNTKFEVYLQYCKFEQVSQHLNQKLIQSKH